MVVVHHQLLNLCNNYYNNKCLFVSNNCNNINSSVNNYNKSEFQCDELNSDAKKFHNKSHCGTTTTAAATTATKTVATVITDYKNCSDSDCGSCCNSNSGCITNGTYKEEKFLSLPKSDCGDKEKLLNEKFYLNFKFVAINLLNNKMKLKYFICILIILMHFLDYTCAHQNHNGDHLHGTTAGFNTNDKKIYHHSSDDFSKHTIIRPKLQHGRHKRPMENTLEEDGLHVNYLTLRYEYNNKDVIIDLQLNYNLIPEGHFLSYQTPDGKKVVRNLTKTETDFCHYHGTIRGSKDSRVALSTCKGINGIVFDGDNTYHIQSGPDNKIHSDHFLYDHADMVHNATCGYVGGINTQFDPDLSKESEFHRILRYKRAASSSDGLVRGPYNSNKDSAYVELVIVIDNHVYRSKGESLREVYTYAKELANIMNSLYVPLNIFIALVGVVVWTENNEVELSNDGDKTLKNFLHYRKSKLIKEHPNDNAQLLTNEKFDGGVVGKALKGPICTIEYSGGVSMDHSTVISVVATTMAHELGHNFGMEHDLDDCKCVDDRCIMAASSSSVSPKHWSSCSIDQLNLAFHHGMNHCLKNKPKKLFDTQTCGNGFVEPGEQCDCGVPEVCNNSCCDPNTCMLHANASCATGECCDLSTCRPRVPGYECRAADGECDLPEYCTGESEYCPNDVFKRDTESCGNNKAYCYRGSCRSHTDQCKVLWGPSGKSSDQCYDKNRNGSAYGNCGHNKLTNTFTSCKPEDIYCGLLHCRHLNEKLEFGMESIAVLSHTYINYNGNIIPCRTAVVDLGMDSRDPGLTPDGAKCGDNRMCVNQKCTAIENLRVAGKGVACPEDCNGHGICNSEGNCHCFLGFAPPTCKDPGAGGSTDSGPASNIQENSHIVRIMTIFFLGVVPTMSLIAFAIFYWRQNRSLPGGIGRKASNVLMSTTKTGQPRNPPSSPNQQTSTPSSPDDMNSALLKTSNDEALITNNTMFGKFKGFTLKPLPKETSQIVGANVAYVHPVTKITDDANTAIIRAAPPPPKPVANSNTATLPSAAKTVQNNKILNRSNTTATATANTTTVSRPNLINPSSPALPPLNPGSNPRPIISSPILETSTCTAKELLSPLRNNASKYPIRAAPTVPPVEIVQPPPTVNIENEKEKRNKDIGGTLQRIASFLKKDEKQEKKSNSLKRNASIKRAISIDKEKLKNIEISGPIPQPTTPEVTESIEENNTNENRISVNRTQSMRDTQTQKKPAVQTFGSMRQPAASRPKSLVGSRPKSPPPPRPPVPPTMVDMKIPGLPGYQNPPAPKKVVNHNDYDDCEAIEAPMAHISEENSPTGDNIYAVIDESPPQVPSIQPPINKNIILPAGRGGSIESVNMSLLGEIVNEIENRNLDSIYSASTLKKKKKGVNDTDSSYANASDNQDDSDNEYSNTNIKSNSSTTSSGYLRPSAINTPIARVAPSKPETVPDHNVGRSNVNYITPVNNSFSSFKAVDNKTPNTNNSSYPSRNLTNNNNNINNRNNINNKKDSTTNSTFKGTINSNKSNNLPATFKSGQSENTPSKPSLLSRTVTPPHLKSINTTSFRNASQKLTTPTSVMATTKPTISSPKSLNPDLVSSTIKSKPPDILTNSGSSSNNNNHNENQQTTATTKPKTLQKPKSVPNNNNITATAKSNQPNSSGDKLVSSKATKLQHLNSSSGANVSISSNLNSKKITQNGSIGGSAAVTGGTGQPTAGINSRVGGKSLSTVASLQQKFESGNRNKLTSAANVKK